MMNNCYRFEDQWKETWIHALPSWLIAVCERLLELYTDSTTQFIKHAQGLNVMEVLDDQIYLLTQFLACVQLSRLSLLRSK